MKKEVIIWSEGTRMAADLFLPDDLRDGEKRPAILLCHGWAGPKSHLSSTYASLFLQRRVCMPDLRLPRMVRKRRPNRHT